MESPSQGVMLLAAAPARNCLGACAAEPGARPALPQDRSSIKSSRRGHRTLIRLLCNAPNFTGSTDLDRYLPKQYRATPDRR